MSSCAVLCSQRRPAARFPWYAALFCALVVCWMRLQGQARLNNIGRLEKVSRMMRSMGVSASGVKLLYITPKCSLNYTKDPAPPVASISQDASGSSAPHDLGLTFLVKRGRPACEAHTFWQPDMPCPSCSACPVWLLASWQTQVSWRWMATDTHTHDAGGSHGDVCCKRILQSSVV